MNVLRHIAANGHWLHQLSCHGVRFPASRGKASYSTKLSGIYYECPIISESICFSMFVVPYLSTNFFKVHKWLHINETKPKRWTTFASCTFGCISTFSRLLTKTMSYSGSNTVQKLVDFIPVCKSWELEQAMEKWQQNQNNFGQDKILLTLEVRVYSLQLEKIIILECMLMSWKCLSSRFCSRSRRKSIDIEIRK